MLPEPENCLTCFFFAREQQVNTAGKKLSLCMYHHMSFDVENFARQLGKLGIVLI